MPKKKPKAEPADKAQIHIRLDPAELAAVDEDRKGLPGIPVGRNPYAKHAVLSYPKLRKLEEAVRRMVIHGDGDAAKAAIEFINEAGL